MIDFIITFGGNFEKTKKNNRYFNYEFNGINSVC